MPDRFEGVLTVTAVPQIEISDDVVYLVGASRAKTCEWSMSVPCLEKLLARGKTAVERYGAGERNVIEA